MSAAQSDLLRGASAVEQVPGDPDGCDLLAQRLMSLSGVFADAAQALGRVKVSWCGPAADAFRSEFDLQPAAFASAASSFSDAGLALGSHALVLDSARSMASAAIDLWQAGMRAARTVAVAPVSGPIGDGGLLGEPAGAQQRLAAVEKLDVARAAVEASGVRAAGAMRSAVTAAPEWSSAWQHLGGFVTDAGPERRDFFAGGLTGLMDMAFAGDPTGLLAGPLKAQVNEFEWQHGVDPRSGWHMAGSIVGPALVGGPGSGETLVGRLGLLDTAASKPANVLLYRGMRAASDGLPEVGDTAKTLGVRVEGEYSDIAPDSRGVVWPTTGGMSANTSIDGIKDFRKPVAFGGTGKGLTLFSIRSDELDSRLTFVPDEGSHGTVQPVEPMSIDAYRKLLSATRPQWKEVDHGH